MINSAIVMYHIKGQDRDTWIIRYPWNGKNLIIKKFYEIQTKKFIAQNIPLNCKSNKNKLCFYNVIT